MTEGTMGRTRWQTLVLIAVVTGVVTYFLLANLQARGSTGLVVPLPTGAGPALLALVLLGLGRGVRRLVGREETAMTPLGAARVVALAKASALVGAGLVGYFGAQLLLTLDHLIAPLPRQQALASGLALLACLSLVGVALLVEHWCRVPPEDDEDPPAPRAPSA